MHRSETDSSSGLHYTFRDDEFRSHVGRLFRRSLGFPSERASKTNSIPYRAETEPSMESPFALFPLSDDDDDDDDLRQRLNGSKEVS